MRSGILSILTGVGALLIPAGSASAGFVGIKVIQKTEALAYGLFVCNVYAVFDRPDDEMIMVFGTHEHPLNIYAINGYFFQHPQGQPLTAPFLQFLPGNPPTLAYDTFVTIGTKVNDIFTTLDDVSTTPGIAFTPGALGGPTGAWFILPSGPGQGGLGAPDANGQVLLGQFTIEKGSGATGVAGLMLLEFTSNGVPYQEAYVEFIHLVPAPEAFGLLGLGVLAGRRRRR